MPIRSESTALSVLPTPAYVGPEGRPFDGNRIPAGPWRSLWDSWVLELESRNKSPQTIATYSWGLLAFVRFLGEDSNPRKVTPAEIKRYMAHLTKQKQGSTALNRYRQLSPFFAWLEQEGEIELSPFKKCSPPDMGEGKAPEVVREGDIAKLLKACEGKTFNDRRDAALLRLMFDAGPRSGGVVSMKVSDVDLRAGVAQVREKGNKTRLIALGVKVRRDLDRYLRVRNEHKHAESDMLWLGERGPLVSGSIRDILEKRCAEAGIGMIHPHMTRHTWAHNKKRDGMSDEDLMMLGGWSNSNMVARYGRSASVERALAAGKKTSLGDRL